MDRLREDGFYFYVLYCSDQTLYGGYTVNLAQRIACHNQGKGAKYTRPSTRRPVRLIYCEKWPSKSLAMSAEYYFKQLTRPQKERYLKEQGLANLGDPSYVMRDFSLEKADDQA